MFLSPERYVDLRTDFGFKRVFGTDAHKHLTIDFLNTLLPAHHQIQDLTFKKTENLGKSVRDRRAVFDIFCQGENGDQFIVEMQKTQQDFFKDRTLFYTSFPIQEQATRGDWNYQLPYVYSVSVLDFIMDAISGSEQLVHEVELKDQNGKLFYDKLKLIYIELPRFNKTLDELKTQSDKWFYLFRHLPELNAPPERLDTPIFEQLFEVAEIANFSDAEQDRYQDALKVYRDFNNVLRTAERKGACAVILRQLNRQLSQLPKPMVEAVNLLSIEALDHLGEALFDFKSIEDLGNWLNGDRQQRQ